MSSKKTATEQLEDARKDVERKERRYERRQQRIQRARVRIQRARYEIARQNETPSGRPDPTPRITSLLLERAERDELRHATEADRCLMDLNQSRRYFTIAEERLDNRRDLEAKLLMRGATERLEEADYPRKHFPPELAYAISEMNNGPEKR